MKISNRDKRPWPLPVLGTLFRNMTEAEAFNYVSLFCEPRRDPILLDQEISIVLMSHKRFEGGWDLDWAILDCWKLKLAKCSDYYDVTVGGRDHSAEAVSRHCAEQIEIWSRRINGSVCIGGEDSDEILIVANYNAPVL